MTVESCWLENVLHNDSLAVIYNRRDLYNIGHSHHHCWGYLFHFELWLEGTTYPPTTLLRAKHKKHKIPSSSFFLFSWNRERERERERERRPERAARHCFCTTIPLLPTLFAPIHTNNIGYNDIAPILVAAEGAAVAVVEVVLLLRKRLPVLVRSVATRICSPPLPLFCLSIRLSI